MPEVVRFVEAEINLASSGGLSVEELAAVVDSVVKPRHFKY